MLHEDQCWQAIQARDPRADGTFFVAVKTTGIYCRPSCKSRMPKRENVIFFVLPALAEAAGFRACKRCRPRDAALPDARAELVEAVCTHIHARGDEPLSLAGIGAAVGYDASHVADVFKAVIGVTPHQYHAALRIARFKTLLRAGVSVTDAIYAAGYSSTSRVYERSDTALGMTPATYRKGGVGEQIAFTGKASPFGVLVIAATDRGICHVGLYDDDAAGAAGVRAEYPEAQITRADADLAHLADRVLDHVLRGAPLDDLPLDLQGTTFQARVWAALRAIPRGETRTYTEIAHSIGKPTAARAVAAACADNRAALIVPCHRVVGKNGALTGYKWGVARKQHLLDAERASEATAEAAAEA